MTPQEQQMIDGLVKRIVSTPVVDKDLEADQYLQRSLAGTPDAVYVLAQTVLVQQYGLQQAKDQIADLQSQLDQFQTQQQPAQASSGGSFLSHLFGGPSQSTPPPPQPAYQPPNNASRPSPSYSAFGGQSAAPPAYAQPMMYPAPVYAAPSATGGFLRGALQTAAGVAAGEVAFAGMESLFHGFGGGGYGGGMGGFGGGFEGGPREEVVNNYYGDSDRGEGASGESDRDSSTPDQGFDDSSTPDQGFDDSSSDNSSYSSDDSGGDSGGGGDF